MPSKSVTLFATAATLGLMTAGAFAYPFYASSQFEAEEAEAIAELKAAYPQLQVEALPGGDSALFSTSRSYLLTLTPPNSSETLCVQVDSTVAHSAVSLAKGKVWEADFMVLPETGTDCSLAGFLTTLAESEPDASSVIASMLSKPLFTGSSSRSLGGAVSLSGQTPKYAGMAWSSGTMDIAPILVEMRMADKHSMNGTARIDSISGNTDNGKTVNLSGIAFQFDVEQPFPERADRDEIWTGTSAITMDSISLADTKNEQATDMQGFLLTGDTFLKDDKISLSGQIAVKETTANSIDLGGFGYTIALENLDATSYNKIAKLVNELSGQAPEKTLEHFAELQEGMLTMAGGARIVMTNMHHSIKDANLRMDGEFSVRDLQAIMHRPTNTRTLLQELKANLSLTVDESYIEAVPALYMQLNPAIPEAHKSAAAEGMRSQVNASIEQFEAQGFLRRTDAGQIESQLSVSDGNFLINGEDAGALLGAR